MADYLFPDDALTAAGMASRLIGNLPGHLGVEAVDVGRDRMVLELDVKANHMAPNGFLHAGTIVTLADTAAGFSTLANLRTGQGFTTLELKSNFLSTMTAGRLRAATCAIHVGKSTHIWDAEVTNAETGKRIALFRCTQLVLTR